MKLGLVIAALGAASAALLATGCADLGKPAAAKATSERHVNAGQGESWDAIKNLPDFWGGVWQVSFMPPKGVAGGAGLGPPPPPPLKPEYEKKYQAFLALQKAGKAPQPDTWNCVPYTFPTSMHEPYPLQFLFTPKLVTIAIETDSTMRRIFTDGRKLPDDPDETYQGYSVGHWEGDTLVADTVGLVPDMKIAQGVDHSDKLMIEERMHLVGPDDLEIDTTINDPNVLTQPWTTKSFYKRHRDWDIQEYICLQNDRDHVDAQGRPSMDLTRKPGE